MRLDTLSDQQLHVDLQALIQGERQLLTKILHHLKEVERRKLFCDFGCSSLFDYAVGKLGYSEGQAHRRIQAMRLMRELPQVEQKIAAGTLNLSNISQAQSLFNEVKKQSPAAAMSKQEKLAVLKQLENKSTRDGQKTLLKLRPEAAMPKDRERQVTDSQVEVRFVIDDKLKAKLEEVRSLLGKKGVDLSYAELLNQMADLSLDGLRRQRFGARRVSAPIEAENKPAAARQLLSTPNADQEKPKLNRYVTKKTMYEVWQRDHGRCQQCGGRRRLNNDHVIPLALRGQTNSSNLRLLCFHCNQRAAMRVFGVEFMLEKQGKS